MADQDDKKGQQGGGQTGAGQGRGWHGDSAGHAAAGSQSHKND